MADETIKYILKDFEQNSIGLDRIHVAVSENLNLPISNPRQTIKAWFEIYKNAETLKDRVNLRDVAIKIAELYGFKNAVSNHGSFAAKFHLAAPYYFFLTTVARLEKTFKQSYSVSFHEIMDYSVGEIVDSLHITFMFDILWTITEYMLAGQCPKMTVVCGIVSDRQNEPHVPFDIDVVILKMTFGCHHSKISIFKYKNDSIRIIIGSANLYRSDWEKWTQGIWISPILPRLPKESSDNDGEATTFFKEDFMNYLKVYEQPELDVWKSVIARADFSAVKVFFFASVPDYHYRSALNSWGHRRIFRILKTRAILPENSRDWPVIAQSSSVGIYGPYYRSWMLGHIVHAMTRSRNEENIRLPEFKFVYPSQETFNNSFDKESGETALNYYEKQHLDQDWIEYHLVEWKSEKRGRSKAMPHIKTYTRISPDETEIAWFILTSANLSKAAWGKMINNGYCQYIANYEAGVVFIPQMMINRPTFPIKKSSDPDVPVFLLPYDLPLTSYKQGTKPALIPGARPTEEDQTVISEEESETDTQEQEDKKEQANRDFFSDERVRKMLSDLLRPEKTNFTANENTNVKIGGESQ